MHQDYYTIQELFKSLKRTLAQGVRLTRRNFYVRKPLARMCYLCKVKAR